MFRRSAGPYGPFAEALGHLISHAPEGLLAEHVIAAGGDLARFIPKIQTRVSEATPPSFPGAQLRCIPNEIPTQVRVGGRRRGAPSEDPLGLEQHLEPVDCQVNRGDAVLDRGARRAIDPREQRWD
ncbi:MAG: hypothetical protein NVSMB4_02390 [Acidimicrobiales bacterium]